MRSSFDALIERISSLLASNPDRPVLVALDGRCGAGKSTLAARLAELFCENIVLHTDDYYLPPERRAPGWETTPCANMELDRLRDEALSPLRAGYPAYYRAYCCAAGAYRAGGQLTPKRLVLIEGSYSLHPKLTEFYDLKVFVTCPPDEQLRRLKAREGDRFAAFSGLWIPLEEAYFKEQRVEERADIIIDT